MLKSSVNRQMDRLTELNNSLSDDECITMYINNGNNYIYLNSHNFDNTQEWISPATTGGSFIL